ncbi:hypothetical protein Tdes44962_MAKER08080 [Teratosphaeria destructans]|uniref:Uncharacterized protein n=1 Tax=Teratosphaeria destructans TaxID=418781 RepID=A0A9W7SXA4_9PEZI|nr:hypothetical protein Tdes44962_MAKER08080 [Teratosphaeria destructans]
MSVRFMMMAVSMPSTTVTPQPYQSLMPAAVKGRSSSMPSAYLLHAFQEYVYASLTAAALVALPPVPAGKSYWIFLHAGRVASPVEDGLDDMEVPLGYG